MRFLCFLFCLLIITPLYSNHPQGKPTPKASETAVFAMGCFWSSAAAFTDKNNKKFKGIYSIEAGYTGGKSKNPTDKYHKGHREAVRIIFNPKQISYRKLLHYFWRNIDPFDGGGQFRDRGSSYEIGIFYVNDKQRQTALKSKKAIERQFGKKSAVDILKAKPFYPAGEHHQDYKERHPIKYKMYNWKSGKTDGLRKIWGNKK